DQNASLIGTGLTTTVCPTTTSFYTAQVVYQNCTGGDITASDQIVVDVSNSAYAGPDDSICGLNYTLNGSSSGPGNWSVSGSGIATVTDNTDTISSVNVTNFGTYTFVWTIGTGSGACHDTVLITFNEIPTASAGPSQPLCQLNTTLAAIPSVGVGTWTVTGPGTITFGDIHLATTTVTASVEGQYIFTWTEVNGTTCTSSSNVTITFTQMPVADAGPDQNLCQLNTTLAAAPSVGTGTWTQTSGSGTIIFTNANDSASSISTTTTQGVYVLTWTEDNGNGCISSDQVQVTLSQTPIANAGADVALCLLTYNLDATPSVGTGTWTYTGPGTATFNNSNSPTATTIVSQNGIYTFTWTENNTNGCVDSDAVVINFTQIPTTNAGPDISLCQLNTNLAAIASVGIGTWTVSGPGVLTIASPDSATTYVSTTTQGVYNLTWTEDNGNGCTNSDNMILTLTNQPISNAGVRDSICSLTYQLNATPSFGTGTWSQLDGPGFSSFTNQNFSASSVTVTQYGNYHFIWAEDNGHGCIDADTTLITFNYIPTSLFTVDSINCFGDDATVTYTGNGELNAQYSWVFTNANVLSGTTFGPYEIDYSNTGTNDILLTVTQHGCVSPVTSKPVFNPPLLTVSLSKTDVTCNGLADGQVFTTVTGGTLNYNYLWSSGSVLPSIVSASPNEYRVTITDANGCTVKDSITVLEPPKLAIDMPHNVSICDGNDTTIIAAATGGTFPYTLLWNTGSTASSINVAPHVTTIYNVIATDANQCTSLSNVEVYVYPPLLLTATQSKDSVCPGENFVISALASDGKGEPYTYYIDGTQTTVPATIFPNDQHTYQIIAKDGCNYQAQTE
ncbi:MAG: hypothetical protein ACYC6C_14685, partial [Coriobacteriia bacterium]